MTASNDLAPMVHDVPPGAGRNGRRGRHGVGDGAHDGEPGGIVAAGDVVAVIEAMKMETGQVSPTAGTLAEIRVVPGEVVAAGGILAVIDPRITP